MAKKASSQRWCLEHEQDVYVKQAHQEGYRSRAVFKLAQIDERDHLFRPNTTVVDLGAAPGGWSQWVKQKFQDKIHVIALDILPMPELAGVTFIQGDFREEAVLTQLLSEIGQQRVEVVMSDMAPNMSGERSVDQPRAMYLVELALELALQVLSPNGHFIAKVFQGEGFDSYLKQVRSHFKQVLIRKPDASRARSAEIYIVAKHFQPSP